MSCQQNHSEAILEVVSVNQLDSSPKMFSSAEDGIRMHIRAGCLRASQMPGPITIRVSERYLVQCVEESFLVSEVVDCQPSGMKFDEPLHLDFRIKENFEEDSEDESDEDECGEFKDKLDITQQREEYMRSLEDSHKVRYRIVQWLRE